MPLKNLHYFDTTFHQLQLKAAYSLPQSDLHLEVMNPILAQNWILGKLHFMNEHLGFKSVACE